jgi:hypothetical protein
LTSSGHRLARLTFAASGRWLAGTTDDGGVHLWSVADGARTIVRAAGPMVDALFFTADERSLVFADQLPRLTAWDLGTKDARELPLARAARLAIDARPLADGGVLQWNRSEYEAAIQALAPDGERRFVMTSGDPIRLADLSADGRRLVVSSGRGRPELWRVDGDRLTREAIDLGDAQHHWQASAQAEDGSWTRLAATLEPEPGQVAGFVVYEVVWAAEGLATAHVLHEDDAARQVIVDPASGSVIVVGEGRRELWQLRSGAVSRLPACVAQIHGFALAPDRRAVVVLGNEGGRSVSDTACFVDLASGAQQRWTTSGDPWAWDGRRTLASVFRGAEVDLREDPTPDEADAFLRWLGEQTRRELPLAALMGR